MKFLVPSWAGFPVLALFGLLSEVGCSPDYHSTTTTASVVSSEDLDLGPVSDFSLVDQKGRNITRKDLLGKVWVASFIFTRCTTLCPQISGSVGQLAQQLQSEPDLRFVSITVDPDFDTQVVLKKYADQLNANPGRWLFLTGPKARIYELCLKSFHLGVAENQGAERTAGNEVTHSSRLGVVDRRGRVRGFFDGRRVGDDGQPIDDMSRIKGKLEALLKEHL